MAQWIPACAATDIDPKEVIRFDHGGRTFALYQSPEGDFYCTDGLCTHEKIHLAGGLVMDHTIKCPKHNALFDYRTGKATRAPACITLQTHPVRVESDQVFIEI